MPETPFHFNEFDAAVVGQALGAEPRVTRDVAHGDGEALDVGETTLEVYPTAGVTRVTTPDARIELYRVPSYAVTGERVVFEQGDQDDRSRLLVRDDGKVSFYPVLRATESSRTGDTALSGRQDSPATTDPPNNVTRRNDATPTSSEGEKGGEVQTLRLQGRLGSNPWFRLDQEPPVGGFPLAVHSEQGQTTWHKVIVFDSAAGQLHEAVDNKQIGKGRLVEVTGQTVVREEPKANGGVKKSAEFHATDVTRVQATRSRPTR
jgi:hypothetical protein